MPQPRIGLQQDLRRRYSQSGPSTVRTQGSVFGGPHDVATANAPFAYGRRGESALNTPVKNYAAFPRSAYQQGLVHPNVPVKVINPKTGLTTTVVPKDVGPGTAGNEAVRGVDISPTAAAAIKYPGSGPLQLDVTPPGYTTPQYPKAQPIAYAPGEPGQPVGGKYYGPSALGPAGYTFQSNIPTGAPYSTSPGVYGAPAAPNSIGPSQSLGTVAALYNPPDPFKFDIQTGLSYGDPFGFNTSGDFGGYDLGSNPYDLYPGQTPAGITVPPLGVNDVPQSQLTASSNMGAGVMSTDNPETQIPSIEINAGGPDSSQQFSQPPPPSPDVTSQSPYSSSTPPPIDTGYGFAPNAPLIPITNEGVTSYASSPYYGAGATNFGGIYGGSNIGFLGTGFATSSTGTWGGFGQFGSLGYGAFGTAAGNAGAVGDLGGGQSPPKLF